MWLTAQDGRKMPKKWDGIIQLYIYIIHIAFILIYAPWPTKKTTVAHYWAMAHRLKTPALNNSYIENADPKTKILIKTVV